MLASKKSYQLAVIVLTVFLFLSIKSFSQGGNYQTYNSVLTGCWVDDNSWQDQQHPDTIDLQQVNININSGHKITLTGNLTTNNMVTINIFDDATLEVTGDVTLKNSFELNVHEDGNLIVGGDLNIDAGGGHPIIGQIMIDGNVEVGGDLIGNANVTGNGYLYVDGIIGDGISFDGSNVTVICGTKAPPQNLNAEVYFNNTHYSVNLMWGFDNSTPHSTGVNEFIVTRNDTVIGSVEYGSKSDGYSYIDSGLEAGARPIYKVYALYNDNIMSEPAIKSFENDPLPVELLYFNASPEKDYVLLDWVTASEINNDFFTLERSTDGKSWTIIGYVQGAGNTNHARHYEYKDNNPVEGVSYYRLKQTDFDGQYEYFEPVVVQFNSDNNKLQIVNVRNSRNNLTIVFNCNDHNAILEAIDVNGRVIHRQILNNSLHLQETNINLSHNYQGEVLFIRLYSNYESDHRKVMVY